MLGYQVEIKQLVDYPRCRVHREFIQTLIADRSIRTNNGCSGLFYYAVLCSYHDTWRLLKKYRDVVWSLELSVQQLKKQFEVEYRPAILQSVPP